MKQNIYIDTIGVEDIDVYEHMNNARYAFHFHRAEKLFLKRITHGDFFSGSLFVPLKSTYKYNIQVMPGDQIIIDTKYTANDNGDAIFTQQMYSNGRVVAESTKTKKANDFRNLHFDTHVFNLFVSQLLEQGRLGLQELNKLKGEFLKKHGLMLVVRSSEIEYKDLHKLVRSLEGKGLTLESQLGSYKQGPRIWMDQKVYSQNGHKGEVILTGKSKHGFIYSESGQPCRYPLKHLRLTPDSLNKPFELEWNKGIEDILKEAEEEVEASRQIIKEEKLENAKEKSNLLV